MSKTKKEHYVPQFYLKNFANDKSQIYVFDKTNRNQFKTTINNIACENYFYDLPKEFKEKIIKDTGEEFTVEKYFNKIENNTAKVINNLINNFKKGNLINIDGKQKKILSYFFTFQYFRSKEFRETIIELYKKTSKEILDIMIEIKRPEFKDIEYRLEFNRKYAPIFQAQFFFDLEKIKKIAYILSRHIWVICMNMTKNPFFISDNPIVKKGHIKHSFYSSSSIISPGIEISFPITPNCAILMYERNYFKKNMGKLDNKYFPIMDSECIKYYNSLQIYQSYRQIYSINNDFNLIYEMIKNNPEICNINRPRVKVGW